MITQLQEQGAVTNVVLSGSTPFKLGWGENVRLTGAGSIVLPSPASLPRGGPVFALLNASAGSVAVTTSFGSVPSPIPAGKELLLYTTGIGWRGILRSGPSAHTVQSGRSDPVSFLVGVEPAAPVDCSQVCNPSQTYQTLQMFINSADAARNSQRDPIRGADVRVPDLLEITLSDLLERDTNHSHTTEISNRLKQLLFRNPIKLTYDGVGTYGTSSRHPHHVRLDAGTLVWSLPSQTVSRGVWRYSQQYKVAGVTRSLEVRFVAEQAAASDEQGAWGVLFSLYVFSNEINPSFVEGDTVNGIVWNRNDPLVYVSPGYVVGLVTRRKRFHPQLLVAAHIPTTFQAPAGGVRVPVGNELWEYEYRRQNGSPWSNGLAMGGQAINNSVFCRPKSGGGLTRARCMTVGGDVPTSILHPFLTIENGDGYGGTHLKPVNAGWDEDEGELTILSDIRLRDCRFSQPPVSTCFGHPAGLYGIGGTHRCFLTTSGLEQTCYPPASPVTVVVRESCCAFTSTLDELCVATDKQCMVASWYVTSFRLRVDDYNFGITDPLDRFIEWRATGPNPDYVRSEWIPDLTYLTQLTAPIGTWTNAMNVITVTTVAGAGWLRAINYWLWASGAVCAHSKVSARFMMASATVPHCFLLRHNGATGYVFEANPGTGTVRIYFDNNGTPELLVEKTGVSIASNLEASAEAIGTHLVFRVGTHVVEADDARCKRQGLIGLATTSITAGAIFENFLPEDWNNRVSAPGSFVPEAQLLVKVRIDEGTPQLLTVEYDEKLCGKYLAGGCTGVDDEVCGELIEGECSGGCTKTEIQECPLTLPPTTFNSTDTFTTPASQTTSPPAIDAARCPGAFVAVEVKLPATCIPSDWGYLQGIKAWAFERDAVKEVL